MLSTLLAVLFAKRVVVRDWSMSPTLLPGDYVLVDRLAYRHAAPQRGDIVLARHPHTPGMLLIKRVAALPGDRVRCDGQECWVNEVRYDPLGAGSGMGRPTGTWLLGADQYFLVGDAAAMSRDSRHFGPVPRQALIGRAWYVYWPTKRAGPLSGPGRPHAADLARPS